MIRSAAIRPALAAVVVGVVAVGFPASALGARCYVQFKNDTNITFYWQKYAVPFPSLSWPEIAAWETFHLHKPYDEQIPPGARGEIVSDWGGVLTDGCEMEIAWDAPPPTITHGVECYLHGPYWRENTFRCTSWGWVGFRLEDRVDNRNANGATVVAYIGHAGGPLGAGPPRAGPKHGSPPLHRSDLRGRGWHTAAPRQARTLITMLTPTMRFRGCASGQQTPSPSSTTGWLFMRKHDGKETIAGSVITFARSAQARQSQAAWLSPMAIRCLARELSARKGITASARRLSFGEVGDRSAAYRILIRTSRRGKASYLDLVSLRRGRSAALIAFYAEDHQLASDIEHAAAKTLARRIQR